MSRLKLVEGLDCNISQRYAPKFHTDQQDACHAMKPNCININCLIIKSHVWQLWEVNPYNAFQIILMLPPGSFSLLLVFYSFYHA